MIFVEDTNTSTCTRLFLRDFGEEVPTFDDHEMHKADGDGLPFEEFKKQLVKMCETFDKSKAGMRDPKYAWKTHSVKLVPKLAVIEATTCNSQPVAERNLKELGFIQIGPFQKHKHNNTTLSVWIMQAEEFCAAIGYKSKYDPR